MTTTRSVLHSLAPRIARWRGLLSLSLSSASRPSFASAFAWPRVVHHGRPPPHQPPHVADPPLRQRRRPSVAAGQAPRVVDARAADARRQSARRATTAAPAAGRIVAQQLTAEPAGHAVGRAARAAPAAPQEPHLHRPRAGAERGVDRRPPREDCIRRGPAARGRAGACGLPAARGAS